MWNAAFWWAAEHDNEASRSILQTDPPYAEDKRTGVFACRSEYRPNPIAMTVCPILDLKTYFPVCDRVKNATIPAWLRGWPEWMPRNDLGLEY